MVTVTTHRRRTMMTMCQSSSSNSNNHDHKCIQAIVKMVMTLVVFVMVMVFYWESSIIVGGDDLRGTTLWNSNHSSSSSSSSSLLSNVVSFPTFTEEQGRQHVLDLFKEAGVDLTPQMEAELPSWSQVQKVVGPHPYIVGLERCETYRRNVPPLERMLGPAGMFNSGTNLVTHLLKQNCEIPERRQQAGPHQSKEAYGMRWQVPWGKHTPAKFRDLHATQKAMQVNKDYILPVITLRNPYTWFRSTCKSPYTASWKHRRSDPSDCPSIKNEKHGSWNNVDVHYGAGDDHHKSIAHLWNDWYNYYIKEAPYPWIAIRMEDLVFYPKETIQAVCECAGGKIRTDQPFKFIVESAKADSPGHDASTGIYSAWIKYSKLPPPKFGFSDTQYEAAVESLDPELMKAFGYHHP